MAQLNKEELSFVEDFPKHVEIECPVCLNILTDPHLVSCCGHNFCGSCIERVKASNGSCPMCKEKEYQAIPDKKCSRIINGLEVYCSNKEKGCQWKGELRNMFTHLNKGKREGECQYQPVDCVFSWAGCNDKPLRKDVHVHTADTKHMTLLAVACGQLKKENEQIKLLEEKNQKLKSEVDKLEKHVEILNNENTILKDFVLNNAKADNSYPLLPVDVTEGRPAVHFYTSACGQHMSARLVRGGNNVTDRTVHFFILLAFHEGKFDKLKPKLRKMFTDFTNEAIPLIEDTEATHQELPTDILNGIELRSGDATVPEGVIKITLVLSWFSAILRQVHVVA
uniref:RING-type domain-containing protein n=1 Tax=Amphimedon queenslandica TaxID=400682 RepID=A0A1X7TNN2_AMPQE